MSRIFSNNSEPSHIVWERVWARVRQKKIRNLLCGTLTPILLSLAACHHGATCPPGATLMGHPPPDGQETWCQKIVDGKAVKEGLFTLYRLEGQKMIEGYYHDGKQVGEWRTWYDNGQLSAIDHYKNGVQDGLHISWYGNGQKSVEGYYKDGKREGKWHYWDANGLRNWDEVWKDDKKIS